MTFLRPLLLMGLLGAALPVIIHLLGRPRARLLRFPAVALLERALHSPSPRRRLRERLLLLLRIAVVALLALVLARPAIWEASAAPAGARRIAVVLDDSFSMGLRAGGAVLFDAARRRARSTLEAVLDAGGEASLHLGGTGSADPCPELTADRDRLLSALDGRRPGAGTTDLVAALGRARAALRGTGRIVLVTDGLAPFPAGDDVEVIDVGPRGTPANFAVTRVDVQPEDEAAGTLRVIAEVASFSDHPRNVDLALSVDGRIASRASLRLEPRARQSKRLTLRPSSGVAVGRVTLDADDLPIDDVRTFAVAGTRQIRTLLVNGDPRQLRAQDELFYLRTALEAPGEPPVQVEAAPAEELTARLAGRDLVALCNVRSLDDGAAAALRAFVRSGGGLLVSLGDNVDENARLPGDLLPAEISSRWSAGSRAADEDEDRLALLGEADTSHPALAAFAADPGALRSARFWRRTLVRPSAGRDRRTLARFTDGVPALLEREVGEGRVLLFTSTLDRDWNDLVIRPVFAPLIRQIVRHLARRGRVAAPVDVRVGEPCPLPSDGEARVARPDGSEDRASGAAYGRTDVPGFYRITLPDGTEAGCSVNVDTRESDLRRAAAPPQPKKPSTSQRHATPVAHAFAALLLAFLFTESLLTRRG